MLWPVSETKANASKVKKSCPPLGTNHFSTNALIVDLIILLLLKLRVDALIIVAASSLHLRRSLARQKDPTFALSAASTSSPSTTR